MTDFYQSDDLSQIDSFHQAEKLNQLLDHHQGGFMINFNKLKIFDQGDEFHHQYSGFLSWLT